MLSRSFHSYLRPPVRRKRRLGIHLDSIRLDAPSLCSLWREGGRCQRPGELKRDLEQQSAQPTPPPPPPRLLTLSLPSLILVRFLNDAHCEDRKGRNKHQMNQNDGMEAAGSTPSHLSRSGHRFGLSYMKKFHFPMNI